MSARDQAFPQTKIIGSADGKYLGLEGGLTKRELFAAMAMQGLCADVVVGSGDKEADSGNHYERNVVRAAIRFADALAAELAKEQA